MSSVLAFSMSELFMFICVVPLWECINPFLLDISRIEDKYKYLIKIRAVQRTSIDEVCVCEIVLVSSLQPYYRRSYAKLLWGG